MRSRHGHIHSNVGCVIRLAISFASSMWTDILWVCVLLAIWSDVWKENSLSTLGVQPRRWQSPWPWTPSSTSSPKIATGGVQLLHLPEGRFGMIDGWLYQLPVPYIHEYFACVSALLVHEYFIGWVAVWLYWLWQSRRMEKLGKAFQKWRQAIRESCHTSVKLPTITSSDSKAKTAANDESDDSRVDAAPKDESDDSNDDPAKLFEQLNPQMYQHFRSRLSQYSLARLARSSNA